MFGLVKAVGYAAESGIFASAAAGFGYTLREMSTTKMTESVNKFAETIFSQMSALDLEKITAYGKNFTNIENIAGVIKENSDVELVHVLLFIGTAYCTYRAACSALYAAGSLVGIV